MAQWRNLECLIEGLGHWIISGKSMCGLKLEFKAHGPEGSRLQCPNCSITQCRNQECAIAPMRESPNECPDWQSAIVNGGARLT